MKRTISNELRTQLARNFFKTGYRHLINMPETRDLLSTADNTGGALVGQLYSDLWAAAKKQYGPIASLVSTSSNTKGAPLKVSVLDDTGSTMSLLTEGGTLPAEQDPASMFSLISGGTDTLTTSLIYSKQFEDDSDIASFIRRTVFSRPARAIEYAILNGKDSGTDTALPNSPAGGLLASAPVGVASVANTGPSQAQLKALAASTDVAYQNAPGTGFYVNPTTFAYLVAQETSTGESLYKFNGDTLYVGKWPVYVSAANAMPSYNSTTAGDVIALFGSYADAYRYIDVDSGPQVKVVTEAPGLVELLLNKAIVYVRIAGASTIANAVKSMTTTGAA
jgi:HK97 family phage major capsid protein